MKLFLTLFLALSLPLQAYPQTEKDLFYAIFDNNYAAVQAALQQNPDLNATYRYERYREECTAWGFAHVAAAMGNLKILKLLASKGVDFKALVPPRVEENHHFNLATPLHIAANYGNAEVVQFLIEQGIDVNARAKDNRTPLIAAICQSSRSNLQVVKLLLEKGADPSLLHDQGRSALYDAVWEGKAEIARFLLEKGAAANQTAKDPRLGLNHSVTPIYAAIHQHQHLLLQILYDHGATLQTDFPTQPLHWAVAANNVYAAGFLLQRGAKIESENNQGLNPLQLAKQSQNDRLIEVLEKGKLNDFERKLYEILLSDKFKNFHTQERAAPNFSLKDLNNQTVVLENFRGKVVVLNLWATWCPPCRREMPSFKKMLDRLKRSDVVVVTVSIDTKIEKVSEYLAKNQFPFVFLHDASDELRKSYSQVVPSTFIIDKDGLIRASVDGSIDWSSEDYLNLIRHLAQQGSYW